MTRAEYEAYTKAVAVFLAAENIDGFTTSGDSYFSWRYCDCCARENDRGGDRYVATGYKGGRAPTPWKTYGVCPDCVYYAEYGRLDDATMAEIEDS